ncbi:hypothetical protein SUGI_1168870 [Cryptomeria japonica]|uniref:auxin-responsive protein SAUR71 n=1 Tax=Cryptomeria japonica TaxID=3369 RepID=UPI0024147C1C|nr:auxin-responsive protein SAUR71 [Cryptomeria japonica]GLJ54428.1 hypothetical protein SUGI_1168870 [Cryptomeria japonica]
MPNLKKQKNSFKNLLKKVMEFGVNLKSLNAPYTAMNRDSEEKLERKGNSSRWRNARVPHGCLAVYVGQERQRFVIQTGDLSHPVFLMLLEKAKDEYGFNQREGLVVPCDVETFENAMFVIDSSKSASGQFDLERLLNKLVLTATPANT